MITDLVISILRNDSQIQTLLGASSSSDCPIFTTFNFDDTYSKQINVSYDKGETVPFDQDAKTSDGKFIVYILVKDTESEPIKKIHQISKRVLELLDLKGSTLNNTNNTVYWIQKLDTDFTHYTDIHYYELAITFRFVITEKS